ncbi:MAG: hypothetical protein ACREBI_10700 [Nitrosotalea sp.]
MKSKQLVSLQLEGDILSILGQVGSIGTAIGTISLVILFWRTIQQLEETVKVSKIQSQYRFRPWVGPSGKIEFISRNDTKDQFCITVKNYGEIPSTLVVAKYLMKKELPKREMFSSSEISSFNLGPLLPNMEKRYWFFIDSDLIQKAKADSNVFILIYFQYEHHDGRSGYGLISRFDGASNSFVHVDMWID